MPYTATTAARLQSILDGVRMCIDIDETLRNIRTTHDVAHKAVELLASSESQASQWEDEAGDLGEFLDHARDGRDKAVLALNKAEAKIGELKEEIEEAEFVSGRFSPKELKERKAAR